MFIEELAYILRIPKSEIAKDLGVSRQNLQQMNSRKRGIRLMDLIKLKALYKDVNFEDLLTRPNIVNFYLNGSLGNKAKSQVNNLQSNLNSLQTHEK